jgi:hypothetical protein
MMWSLIRSSGVMNGVITHAEQWSNEWCDHSYGAVEYWVMLSLIRSSGVWMVWSLMRSSGVMNGVITHTEHCGTRPFTSHGDDFITPTRTNLCWPGKYDRNHWYATLVTPDMWGSLRTRMPRSVGSIVRSSMTNTTTVYGTQDVIVNCNQRRLNWVILPIRWLNLAI